MSSKNTSIRFLILVAVQLWSLVCFAQTPGISTPIGENSRVLIFQDFIDDFENGLNAGGTLSTFNDDSNKADVETIRLVDDLVHRGLFSAVLETKSTGFTVGNGFVGMRKVFSQPIDASAFLGKKISYHVKSSDSTDDLVALQIIIGEGGEGGGTGSTWVSTINFSPKLRNLNGNDYSQVIVPLTTGLGGGFFSQADSSGFDLSNITAIEVLIINITNATSRRSVFIDDIIFISEPFLLAVSSTPINVQVDSGTIDAITPYTVPNLSNGDQVILTAPMSVQDSGDDYQFRHWIINGETGISGQNIATANIRFNSQATAIYDLVPPVIVEHNVAVLSDIDGQPTPGIAISGTHPGTTSYTATVNDNTFVKLTAPPTKDLLGNNAHFLNWEIEGHILPLRQNTISFTVTDDISATAFYETGNLLTVVSLPATGVVIGGNPSVVTDDARVLGPGTVIQLSAPMAITVGGNTAAFRNWNLAPDISGIDTSSNTISFDLDSDVVATAVYETVWTFGVGWNLIATPVEFSHADPEKSVGSFFDSSVHRSGIWFWDGQQLETAPLFLPLELYFGYWVFNSGSEPSLKPDGQVPMPAAAFGGFSIGWNVFGIGGYQPLEKAEIDMTTALDLRGDIWYWDSVRQQFISVDDEFLPLYKRGKLFPGIGYTGYFE